jgi:glucose-6-phosphate-specific signal transduction histidine kinase
MKKIMQWLMLSCRKATELIEKKLLTNLSFREKVQLKMHKSFCDACTAYEKQSKLIDKLLSKQIHKESDEVENDEVVENEELKKRILDKIK